MPKGTSELSQIKEQWHQKIYDVLRAERDVKFKGYPVSVSINEVKFLTMQSRVYFAVSLSVSSKSSAYIFAFDKDNRNEKYLKDCAQEMFKDIPKMLLEFAKTIMKLNEKGAKVEEA